MMRGAGRSGVWPDAIAAIPNPTTTPTVCRDKAARIGCKVSAL
jgi:hypothetical protein